MKSDFADIKRQLLSGRKPAKKAAVPLGLSTGSTLLNLACSGRADTGFLPGHYYFLVGDSASGKTWLSLTCLAEAAINSHFVDYRFIYDNPEKGALMDIERFFGSGVAERLDLASIRGASSRLEEFYYNLDDALRQEQPCIYILDSMDSLLSDDEESKFQEQKQAYHKGKAVTGSYGTSKPKLNSTHLRRAINQLEGSQSILLIISQTRDNIGFGAQFNPKTRSGGHALRFYASLEIWSSIRRRIKKEIKGKDRQLGIICKAEIKKNRLTGRERTIEIPIYHSSGMDDLGSCVDWLIEEKHWTKTGASISAPEFGFKGSPEKLVQQIEAKGQEEELRQLVASVWNEIETQCEVRRKKRYV